MTCRKKYLIRYLFFLNTFTLIISHHFLLQIAKENCLSSLIGIMQIKARTLRDPLLSIKSL